MSMIHVEHKHSLTMDDALTRARAVTEDIAQRVSATVTWSGTTATFKGTGFSGTAKVAENLIAVDVDLAMLLRPMKAKIEERIERSLEKRFA